MHDLCLGRILAQSPDQIPTLGVSDFHLVGWCPIKQLESVFEVCEQRGYSFLIAVQIIVIQGGMQSLRNRPADAAN